MNIKIPRIRFIRPQHVEHVTESLVRNYLHIAFWVSFIGWWQIYQWAKPYYRLIKPYLEKLQ